MALTLASRAEAQASQMLRWVSSWVLRKLENFFQSDFGGAFQGRLIFQLGQLDGEVDFELVIFQAAELARNQLAGLGRHGGCRGVGLDAADTRARA